MDACDAGPRPSPDWAEIVEASPVPTVLVDCGPTQLGLVRHANLAARSLLAHASATNVLELVDPSRRDELAQQLSTTRDCLAESATLERAGRDARGREFTLHVRRSTGGLVIVQAVDCDGWAAVDAVVDEQQRFRSALMELSELAHTTQDDDDFYQRLIERAVEVVPGAQGGSVQLNIAGTASFRFVAAVGYDLAGLQRHELEQEHFFRDAWDPNAQILHSFDNAGRSAEITEWLTTVGRLNDIQVNVSGPVLSDGLPVAFLSLDNFEDAGAMNETSVEMTTVLSRLIGDLWRRRELEAEVRKEREAFRHLALHDPLTGLANRRNLERSLTTTATLAGRSADQPSCVLFVDLDDFKGVNDRLGHEIGDRLLIAVARGLEAVVDSDDVVGRWGGDEFLVLSTRFHSADEALSAGQRILKSFDRSLELGDDVQYRARMSVGVAWSPTSTIEIDRLIRAADEALYESKAAGKGLVHLSPLFH